MQQLRFVMLFALAIAACSSSSAPPAPKKLGEIINPPTPVGVQVYNVRTYGALGNDTADDSVAVLAALSAAAVSGGTVYFPAGAYRINSQVLLPNDSASIPTQKPIRITGTSPHMTGQVSAPAGGSILDLRYAGSDGTIATFGQGYLELDHLTLQETVSGTTTPFVFTTNTTLHIHDVAFYGYSGKSHTSCDQDAIILGGTTTTTDGTDTAPFQGYGTVIENNYADHVRRFVYLRTYANAVQIVDNTVWFDSGSSLSDGAAIEIDGGSAVDYGNYIAGNLIEMVGYPYGFKLTEANNNTLLGNSFWDVTTPTIAYYDFASSAAQNYVMTGYADPGTKPLMTDATGGANVMLMAYGDQFETYNSFALMRDDAGSHANHPILAINNTNLTGSFNHRAELDFVTADSTNTSRMCQMQTEGGNLTITPYQFVNFVGSVNVSGGGTTLQCDASDPVELSGSSATNTLGNGEVAVRINNSNSTTNNNSSLLFLQQSAATSSIESRTIDSTNHYADMFFMTRGADGYLQRLHLSGTTVDVETQRVVNVVDPSGAQDAATKNYADTHVGTLGVSGPSWTKGAGVPSGSCTIGSLYSNTSGGVSTTLYVCTGSSTWTAK